MKKILLVMAVAAVSCKDPQPKVTVEKCTKANDQRCAGDVLQKCSTSLEWTADKDCAATNQVCKQSLTALRASCLTPKDEYQTCNATSNDCAAGLECVAVQSGNICMTPCTPPATCADGRACMPVSATEGYCDQYPPGEQLAICYGDGQGTCATGLECLPLIDAGADGSLTMCSEACTAGDSSCVAGTYCQPTNFETTAGAPGLCYIQSDRDQACILGAPAAACSTAGAECMYLGIGFAADCKIGCDGLNVNTGNNTGCTGTDQCLAGAVYETQQSAPNVDVTCTVENATGAPCTDNFKCIKLGDGSGSTALKCARPVGWCAQPGIVNYDFTIQKDASGNTTGIGTLFADNAPDGTFCEMPGQSYACAPLNDGSTASVECASSGFFFSIAVDPDGSGPAQQDTIDCMSGGQPTDELCALVSIEDPATGVYTVPGDSQCMQTTNTEAICGFGANACTAFCETRDFQPLVCPTGKQCITPDDTTTAVFDWIFEMNGAQAKACTGNTGCTGPNYTCVAFGSYGSYCAHARKVCSN